MSRPFENMPRSLKDGDAVELQSITFSDGTEQTTAPVDGPATELVDGNTSIKVTNGDNNNVVMEVKANNSIVARFTKYEFHTNEVKAIGNNGLYLRAKLGNRIVIGNYGVFMYSDLYAPAFIVSSDDRLKENETYITNATETLKKLTPQIYDKYYTMDLSGTPFVESGLISQEVWYNAPELRHIVTLGADTDASGNEHTPTPDELDLSGNDIQNDIDYGSHGWSQTTPSSLNYTGLVPYLIKSIQELEARISALEN